MMCAHCTSKYFVAFPVQQALSMISIPECLSCSADSTTAAIINYHTISGENDYDQHAILEKVNMTSARWSEAAAERLVVN